MDWPKCENCIGGKHRWSDGTLHDCPACGGTGERDLEADEAWEFLCEWNPTDADLTAENVGGEVHVSFAAIDGINIKDVCWANYELIPEPGYWCGPTLTAALNAAARAVRARKEK